MDIIFWGYSVFNGVCECFHTMLVIYPNFLELCFTRRVIDEEVILNNYDYFTTTCNTLQ